MDGRNEQRVAIKFCFKASLSVTETPVLKQKAYGNGALNQSSVFRWYSEFRDGRELVEYDERGGPPKSTWTEVNIAAVADLIKNDHRIASRIVAESLNIPKAVVFWILKEDMGKRKLCPHFVPHSLTLEQREHRVTSCQDFIAMAHVDKNFFNKIVTGDETWCFAYDPETKQQFWMGWWDIPSAKETEIPMVSHQDHVDNFFQLSRCTAQRICTKRKNSKCRILWRRNGLLPEKHSLGSSSCVLLSRFFLVARKCARPQSCKCLSIFKPKKCYNPLSPPYSPDLSHSDYFLFPKLKMKLKWLHFADVAEIQEAISNELKKVQK